MCGYVPGVHDVAGASGALPAVPQELRVSFSSERVLEVDETGTAGGAEREVLIAIDTALGTSVALGVDGRIFEAVSDDQRAHAEVIGTLIARVFERSGVSPERVSGVVVGVGPGPFTGLRVGIAAAHAFATGRGVPLLPVHSHEGVALALAAAGNVSAVRVVQDARRRELFVTEYDGLDESGLPVRTADPHLVARAAYENAARDVWPERIPAARLVELAWRRQVAGRGFEADRALYLRQPDVAQPGAPKRVSA